MGCLGKGPGSPSFFVEARFVGWAKAQVSRESRRNELSRLCPRCRTERSGQRGQRRESARVTRKCVPRAVTHPTGASPAPDILSVPDEAIKNIQAVRTVVGGRTVFVH